MKIPISMERNRGETKGKLISFVRANSGTNYTAVCSPGHRTQAEATEKRTTLSFHVSLLLKRRSFCRYLDVGGERDGPAQTLFLVKLLDIFFQGLALWRGKCSALGMSM